MLVAAFRWSALCSRRVGLGLGLQSRLADLCATPSPLDQTWNESKRCAKLLCLPAEQLALCPQIKTFPVFGGDERSHRVASGSSDAEMPISP